MKVFIFICEISVFICAALTVVIAEGGEPVSSFTLYCWVVACLVWVVIASIRK